MLSCIYLKRTMPITPFDIKSDWEIVQFLKYTQPFLQNVTE